MFRKGLVIGIIFLFVGASVILSTVNEVNAENNSSTNAIAIFDTTMGTIKIELFEDKVPITTGNFIDLAEEGYYDGVIFHRVIAGFMIQGGDPTGTGTNGHAAEYHEGYGDPDYPDTWRIPDEFHDDLKHDSAGILSMANAGPNTGGSQFFITVAETSWLDGHHAVFGKVIDGLNAVVSISELDPDYTDNNNKPIDDVIINSITIIQPPDPPTLVSPGTSSAPGDTIETLTPTFQWDSVSDADYYALYISKYPYGSENLVYDSSLAYGSIFETSFTLPDGILTDAEKYRWNMQAYNDAGWSEFSETLYFKTPSGEPSFDMTPTGFYYPTGMKPTHDPPESYGYDGAVTYYQYSGWLARSDMGDYSKGENEDGSYYDRFHIAQDIQGSENDPVYAISDGEIFYVSTGESGGWGKDEDGKYNYGILVKHTAEINGVKKDFIAVYGHVKPTIHLDKLEKSSSSEIDSPIDVTAGQQFAKLDRIFYETEGAVHLHFGIRQEYVSKPPSPYGIMRLEDNWSDINSEPENTNDFVDPINWIETKEPYSQSLSTDEEWDKTFGGDSLDVAYSVQQTSDGGYIVAGGTQSYSTSPDFKPFEVLIIKTDANGDEIWNNIFSEYYGAEAKTVQQTSDGGYIIGGDSKPDASLTNEQILVIKTDSEGEKIWQENYGASADEYIGSILETSDGGYIVVGTTNSDGNSNYDVWLFKIDESGDTEWSETFGGNDGDWGQSVYKTSDGGFIITGDTYSSGSESFDILLIKTDSNGNDEWSQTFGGSDYDYGFDVQQTIDGGFIIVGETNSFGAGGSDIWLIKTDSNGDEEWSKTFGESKEEVGYSVYQTNDGGYVLTGSTESYGAGYRDLWVIKTDSKGNKECSKTFGTDNTEFGNSIQQTSDGGYIVAGTSYNEDSGNFWLIKTNLMDCDIDDSGGESSNGTSAPGFELIFIVLSIAVILFWKRKKRD